jgi:hypothetical protein
MCTQCGDIYYQAGYKVIQIPMPGASPAPMNFAVKEERSAITQEPAGPSKIKIEPWPTTIVKFEAPVFVNKLYKHCLLMNLPLLARSIPTPLWNKPLRPYLSLPLATLKHKLNHGMSRQ